MKTRVVVLISGSGSNLQALIDAAANADYPAQIVAVISNKSDAYGLVRAQNSGIATAVLDHKAFASREEFDAALRDKIDSYQPDLVVLAGFMRILTADFVNHYLGRMLNIHPSLLPLYPGLHTHRRAIEAGDATHGATVHFVTAELDGGPAVVQAEVPVEQGDTEELLAKRVLAQEHRIYPLAVRWFADGDLVFRDGKAWYKGDVIPASGIKFK
ncbi:phosphoribosylglycinamide formyltransferase [Saccharophagus sp. K07]|uniref:phosphoribosylglycinamide formyltransferase n=1 Tax=Saccharophagus sp. K07 TaxID=2283636 RepID=UPI001651ED4F|nr:phosphoribosylglycinamide formyltransferase [Saccharophagus sp. K07]MBC6905585.1 phosphoribosylglycinamide formyltransferase [Saccharophagus sp. K07]